MYSGDILINTIASSRQMAAACMQFSRQMWINLLLVSDRWSHVVLKHFPRSAYPSAQCAPSRTACVQCALKALLRTATSVPHTAGSSPAWFGGYDGEVSGQSFSAF